DRLPWLEALGVANHFLDRAVTELRHELARFLGDKPHEVHDMLRLAGILFAEPRVLRGDAGRTRIQMANTHHDAAGGDERCGGETELLGAEQRGNNDVAAGLELAVGFDGDARAKIIE